MNSFQSISGDSENSSVTPRGVSRRSVMKAGAAAAWSVPLVQVVAAAPAVAASGSPILGFTAWSGSYPLRQSQTLNTSVTLQNTGGKATTSLQVTFDFPSGWTPSVDEPAGWSVDITGQARTHVFTATAPLDPGKSVTLSPTFTVRPQNKGNAVQITGTATSTGSNSPITQIDVAAFK